MKQVRSCAAALVVCIQFSFTALGESTQELVVELEKLKKQISVLEAKIAAHTAMPVKAEDKAQATPVGDGQAQMEARITDKVLEKIQPNLTSVARSSPSDLNPAMSLIVDSVFSSKQDGTENDFEFRSAEVALSANIDPFSKGYAIFNGTSEGVEVEEAAISTTALGDFSIKGGRFFADFGRLSKFHDHDLPFVTRPLVLDRFVDGESQGTGLELNYLVPTSQFLNLTFGAYDKIGAENERVSSDTGRQFNQFTYLGRAATFFEFDDANTFDIGGSFAYTPDVEESDGKGRSLAGIDLTYRYTPLGQESYRGLVWSTELLLNDENRPLGEIEEDAEPSNAPSEFKDRSAFGMYTYLEAKLTRRWNPGFLLDYAQDIDRPSQYTTGYSPYLTFWLSEFQRLRFQYTYLDDEGLHDNQFYLQWTGILGSHAHGFRDR